MFVYIIISRLGVSFVHPTSRSRTLRSNGIRSVGERARLVSAARHCSPSHYRPSLLRRHEGFHFNVVIESLSKRYSGPAISLQSTVSIELLVSNHDPAAVMPSIPLMLTFNHQSRSAFQCIEARQHIRTRIVNPSDDHIAIVTSQKN